MGAIAGLLEGREADEMRGQDQRGSREGTVADRACLVAVRDALAPECSACIHHVHTEHCHSLLQITSGRTMS